MKKFVVLLVVVAICCLSTAAFAADIAVSGSIDIRSRDFNNTLALPESINDQMITDEALAGGASAADAAAFPKNQTQRDTQQRVRLNIDAKAGDVKGKISIENDWDSWGRLENPQANGKGGGNAGFPDFREAWINFNLPGIPANVNAGHQLLQLGNAWFFRSMKYGSDAWVVANVTGANTAAFVNIKVNEGDTFKSDDLDAYAFLDVFKLSDAMMVGVDFTQVHDRTAMLDVNTATVAPNFLLSRTGFAGAFKQITLNNLGLNFNGQLGPMNLKAEIDYQFGKADLADPNTVVGGVQASNPKFKGNQVVVQGNMAMDPATINFTIARGSGNEKDWGADGGKLDIKQMVTILDADQHYTLLYEYKVPTAALNIPSTSMANDNLHTGFANTTALNVGAKVAVAKTLTIGADLWWLTATQAVAIHGAIDPATTLPSTSKKLGTEVDVQVNWQLADALSWNWTLGYFKPGAAYDTNDLATGALVSADAVTGVQGVLSFKF